MASLSDASWTEEERSESAEQPVARRQVGRTLASTAQDDQLLLEQEILRDHRSHATGTTELRGHDGQVKHGEQEVLHARVSVGQTSGATQRCPIRRFSARIGNSRPTGDRREIHGRRRACLPRRPRHTFLRNHLGQIVALISSWSRGPSNGRRFGNRARCSRG